MDKNAELEVLKELAKNELEKASLEFITYRNQHMEHDGPSDSLCPNILRVLNAIKNYYTVFGDYAVIDGYSYTAVMDAITTFCNYSNDPSLPPVIKEFAHIRDITKVNQIKEREEKNTDDNTHPVNEKLSYEYMREKILSKDSEHVSENGKKVRTIFFIIHSGFKTGLEKVFEIFGSPRTSPISTDPKGVLICRFRQAIENFFNHYYIRYKTTDNYNKSKNNCDTPAMNAAADRQLENAIQYNLELYKIREAKKAALEAQAATPVVVGGKSSRRRKLYKTTRRNNKNKKQYRKKRNTKKHKKTNHKRRH
jgi:hypothetical protein